MPRTRTYRVGFCETPERGQELEDYVGQKKRWKSVPDMIRDITWQFISRNALTPAQKRRVEELHGK
jgi:hypothetical protein